MYSHILAPRDVHVPYEQVSYASDVPARYDDLRALRENNPGWRLLRADHAPLIIAFLHRVFVEPNQRAILVADLVEHLADDLHIIRQIHGPETLPRPAADYLDDWKSAERGWLRVTYNDDDQPQAALTSDAESAVNWVMGLTQKEFIGTESRLLTLFDLLRQMVHGAESDPDVRVAELQQQRDRIDDQITQIQAGNFTVMDDAALKDRFSQFQRSSREFLADLRQLEENFQSLGRQVREEIVRHEGPKSELLEQFFAQQDVITDSDEGKSFQAFWEFLLSPARKTELTTMIRQVLEMPAVSAMAPDPRTARLHFDWHDAGDHTQKTVRDLSSQLRTFLEDDARLENKRIMNLIGSIQESALALRDCAPSDFGKQHIMDVDDHKAQIHLPMERRMYAMPITQDMPGTIEDVDMSAIDTTALFNQNVVDYKKLTDNVVMMLREQSSTTLREVLLKFPLSLGLAEIIGYLHVADTSSRFDATYDDSQKEPTYWEEVGSPHRVVRRVWLPEVIYLRKRTATTQNDGPKG